MAATVNGTPVATIEVVEELTEDETSERHLLEQKIERGMKRVEQTFYEIGKALAELRERRLYRSTHKNFGDYCNARFERLKRRQAEYLILASQIIDNLRNAHNCARFPLPTSESQVRSMKDLKPEQRIEVWQTGCSESQGRVPTAKTVKGIVKRLKERNTTPPPIPFQTGEVVLICGAGNPDLRKYDGQWAIALQINEYTVTLAVNGKNISVQPQFLKKVEPNYWAKIKAVNKRITRLQLGRELDPIEEAGLEVMRRRISFTPKQMLFLQWLESNYGILASE